MPGSLACGFRTVLLKSAESRTLTFILGSAASYNVSVRYSNDNYGPTETVTISLDGSSVGQFSAEDTGNYGAGWNVFVQTPTLGTANLSAGSHQVVVSVSGGDGYGVEIDTVILDRTS